MNLANVNVNLMKQIVIQINGRITINVNVSVTKIKYLKKIMFRILVHVVVRKKKYLASIMNNSVITCDEVIDVEETNFNGKNITSKTQIFYI